jgi:hypothetical protein
MSRRIVAGVLVAAVSVVGLNGSTAQAAPHHQSPPRVQFGYTDSATPHRAHDVGEEHFPLGAWKDSRGRKHLSRVYATYDLSGFAGSRVTGGLLTFEEFSATDCTKRAMEVWETDAVSQTPTWKNAPDRVRKLDDIQTSQYCPGAIIFDVSAAVVDAAAAGKPTVTFELRVPEDRERDTAYGRLLNWHWSGRMSVEYNSAPVILAQHRYSGGFPCDDTAPYRVLGHRSDTLQVMAADPDENDTSNIDVEFAVWRQDDPAARITLTNTDGDVDFAVTGTIPEDFLADGQAFSWQARVTDGVATSEWSQPCTFVADLVDPTAPSVASADYPPGEIEMPAEGPGEFTFDAGGDTDTAGFEYTWSEFSVPVCSIGQHAILRCSEPFAGANTVRADVAGGTATVTLTPPRSGTNVLRVRAIDEGGRRSPGVRYEFYAN